MYLKNLVLIIILCWICWIWKIGHCDGSRPTHMNLSSVLSNRNRLMTEAFIQSYLDHPNVLRMCGLIFQPGHYGLVLDFIEAGDMGQYLCNNNVGWTVKVGFMRDIASGMNYLHGQHPPIIHGDLKMKNVLVSSNATAKVGLTEGIYEGLWSCPPASGQKINQPMALKKKKTGFAPLWNNQY